MAETLTLDGLKAQVQKEELEASQQVDKSGTDETVKDDIDAGSSGESETSEADDKSTDGIEAWQQVDDKEGQSTTDNSQSGFTGRDIAAAKTKLRAKLDLKKADEISDINAKHELQLEELRRSLSGKTNNTVKPKHDDFETTDDYETALYTWQEERIEARIDARVSDHLSKSQAQNAQNQADTDLEKSVTQHYERAAQLVDKHEDITAEVYHQADANVRHMVETLYPGAGDNVTDRLIKALDTVGGSDKVFLRVGRNKKLLAQLETSLTSDPDGFKAVAFLSNLSAENTALIKNKTSQAPEPLSNIKAAAPMGDKTSNNLHKKFKEADNSKTLSEAAKIKTMLAAKIEARKLGVNTDVW